MTVVKMEQGWDRSRAANFAWTSTAFPMLTESRGAVPEAPAFPDQRGGGGGFHRMA